MFQICHRFFFNFLHKLFVSALTWLTYVPVERGLIELRKLGLEQQLWETSRKEIENYSPSMEVVSHKHDVESENSTWWTLGDYTVW